MKRIVGDISSNFVTLVMIGIMAMLITNRIAFLHTHMLADGSVVTHAHPYDKSGDPDPCKTHRHTNAEIYFLENLEILFLIFFLALTSGLFARRSRHTIQNTSVYYPVFSMSAKAGPLPFHNIITGFTF